MKAAWLAACGSKGSRKVASRKSRSSKTFRPLTPRLLDSEEMEMNESGVRREGRSTWYFLLLVLVNLMWAFQYTGARIATRKLGPITVTLLPLAMATVLLSLLLLSRRRKENGEVSRERGSFGCQLLGFVILGIGGCFVG